MNLKAIFDIVVLLWIISEIALARLKHSGSIASRQDKSTLRLLWLTIVLSISSAMAVAFYGHGAMHNGRHVIGEVGLALIVIGLIVRWFAILTLWRYFTVDVTVADDHKLVTRGLYGIVRHPSYTGSLLSFAGLGLAFSNWYSLVIVVIPITAAFMYRIKVEEAALRGFFGERYRQYAAETKRLIPMIY